MGAHLITRELLDVNQATREEKVAFGIILLPILLCVSYLMQGLSLSDVMFVTKRNMANAVQSMSKQLEQVSSALAVCFIPNFISCLLQQSLY